MALPADPTFDDLVDALWDMTDRVYDLEGVVDELRNTVKLLDKRVYELELSAFHALWDKQKDSFLRHANKDDKK